MNTNDWTIASEISLPTSFNLGAEYYTLAWNGGRYLAGVSNYIGPVLNWLDLQNIGAGWQRSGYLTEYATSNFRGVLNWINPIVSKVQWSSNTRYGMSVDKDGIGIWTRPRTGSNFWAYAGKVETIKKGRANSLSNVTPGFSVSIQTDTVENFNPLEKISVLIPNTGEVFEASILSIDTVNSTLEISTQKAIPIGAKLTNYGVDVAVTGDTDMLLAVSATESTTNAFFLDEVAGQRIVSNSSIYSEEIFATSMTSNNSPLAWASIPKLKTVVGTSDNTTEFLIKDQEGNRWFVIRPDTRKLTQNRRKIGIGPIV